MRAESRRLMLKNFEVPKGEVRKVSFIVNIRRPLLISGGSVKLNQRGIGKLDWDNKLTLEFSDKHSALKRINVQKVNDQVAIYLAGNSTIVDQDDEPWTAWGQMIPFKALYPDLYAWRPVEQVYSCSLRKENKLNT